jgi:hypothetical protein
MSRTVKVNPLLVLLSILVGASIGSWIGGTFGAFVAALLAIPAAGALQVISRELWQTTADLQPVSPAEERLAEQEELTEQPDEPRQEPDQAEQVQGPASSR